VASLGRLLLVAAASGFPRGSTILLGEDSILGGAQKSGRRFTSGMVLFVCGLVVVLLARIRMMCWPADSLGRLGGASSGFPGGIKLLSEDGTALGGAQKSGRRFACGLVVLARFRLMPLEELSVSMHSFTFGRCFFTMMTVCGIEGWTRFARSCKPETTREGGGQGIG
jgi:hypothetical protein